MGVFIKIGGNKYLHFLFFSYIIFHNILSPSGCCRIEGLYLSSHFLLQIAMQADYIIWRREMAGLWFDGDGRIAGYCGYDNKIQSEKLSA